MNNNTLNNGNENINKQIDNNIEQIQQIDRQSETCKNTKNNILETLENPEKIEKISKLRNILIETMEAGENYEFNVKERRDIPSLERSGENKVYFQAEGLNLKYPDSVKEALSLLYTEFSHKFEDLINTSKEGKNSYQYCFDVNGKACIPFVQIDMPLLPKKFLEQVENENPEIIAEVLRKFIFEFESSIAHYNLISQINSTEEGFKKYFRENLENLRVKTGKKIILLSVTDSKTQSIKANEFGIPLDSNVDSEIIKERSGFDGLWGPTDLKKYFDSLEDKNYSDYIFFTRASADAQKLKGKTIEEENIIHDNELRNFIKNNSVTINIDEPGINNPVNDTKEYMEDMKMGVFFNDISELYSLEANKAREKNILQNFDGQVVSDKLKIYLIEAGVSIENIDNGNFTLRCKPVSEFYGAYGHHKIDGLKSSVYKVKKDLEKNGKYVLQLERPTVLITNTNSGEKYKGIHRIFMAINPNSGEAKFMEGIINMLPAEHKESKKGNIHGNNDAVWGQIS